MKKTDNWMPLHIGPYKAATAHLSTEEHGMYLLLLMHAWMNAGRLPMDEERIARICGATAKAWGRSGATIMAFLTEHPDGTYRQKRLDEELAKATTIAEVRSDAGEKGAEARWQKDGKRIGKGDGKADAVALANECPIPKPIQTTPTPEPTPQPEPRPTPTPRSKPSGATSSLPAAEQVGEGSNGVEAWGAYANAYFQRYNTYPVRNAKTNAIMVQLVKRIGSPQAPLVAAWYVASNRATYVQAKHPTDLLLRDCEGLHTELMRGAVVTETEARQVDRTSATVNAFAPLIAEAQAALGKPG